MSELILCNEAIASMPYYIEGISINVYSIEELSYYILNNTFLLEKDFMNEELCSWIEKEARIPKLAMELRDIVRSNGLLSDFVFLILKRSGYCSNAEVQEIIQNIKQMEEKSDFECDKIRADKLMENGKYLNGIYEYKRMLESEDAKKQDNILLGNINHNLGTAYARMFLFEEAQKYFHKAYSLNQKWESLRECLFTYRCLRDEAGFIKCARDNGLSDEDVEALRTELSEISRNQDTKEFEERLEAIVIMQESDKSRYKEEIHKIIQNYKDEYRRICRV